MSLQIVLENFTFENDVAHSVILWRNFNAYGFQWITDWNFTQDNWLFSLVPINFVLYYIFGDEAFVSILSGWGIFIFSIFISGLIALELSSKKSFYIVTITLLYMGSYAHTSGFVSYATSHGITNLFGLISILLVIKYIKDGKNGVLLFSIFLLLITGALSDPWMIASYTLPIILTSFIIAISYKTKRLKLIVLFCVSICSLILVYVIRDILTFLSDSYFRIGSWEVINSNAVFLLRDLGGLFNIIPMISSNYFISSFISLFFVFVLFISSIYYSGILKRNHTLFIFFVFLLFSTAGISLAFMISDIQAKTYSARFLINILFLVPIFIIVIFTKMWDKIHIIQKVFSIFILFLFIFSGILSSKENILNPRINIKSGEAHNLMNFLINNNLNYGYGPYWGSSANAITILSDEDVIIRPIKFDSYGSIIFGDNFQSSSRWYTKFDYPKNQKTFFVVVANDGEECLDIKVCEEGLVKAYGEPIQTLLYQKKKIMVWKHPLINYINIKNLQNIENQEVLFNSDNVMFMGWSKSEKTHRWSLNNTSKIIFTIKDKKKLQGVLSLKIGTLGKQTISIFINEHLVVKDTFQKWNTDDKFTFNPKLLHSDTINNIRFEFSNPHKPNNFDKRKLAMALRVLKIE